MKTAFNKQKHYAIIAKIRALLDKTTENGATEAEALAAGEKAAYVPPPR